MEGKVSMTPKSDNVEQQPGVLVSSLCHEVGNQLAAVRLSGHVLKFDQSKVQLQKTAQSIEELATLSGALVGLMGPLMGTSKANAGVVNPLDLLDGLTRALPDAVVHRVQIEMPGEGEIPEIVGNFHMLSGLLLALILGSCEASPKGSSVKVSLEMRAQEVSVLIEDEGRLSAAKENGIESALRGRGLMLAVANCLLDRVEGGVELEGSGSESKETRLRVILSRES
jgi:nitrogen-specific signal transduction histidine kinase